MPQVDRIEIATTEEVFLMTRPAYYFGYGPEIDPDIVCAIVDRDVRFETGVTAVDAALFVQDIDQIPDSPIEELGGKSPQGILADNWSKFTEQTFSAYALRAGEGNRSDLVEGTLYELSLDDAARLLAWNLAHSWRTWSFNSGLNFELADGRKSETLTITPDQSVDRRVSGIGYDPYLMGQTATHKAVISFLEDN